jgi:hypothetical protein
MHAPFIFVTTHTIKPGRLDALEALNAEFAAFVEEHEPLMLGLHAYVSEDGRRLTIIQIHPDAESLDTHLEVAGDRIHQAFELVDNESVDVYGEPAAVARGLLEQIGRAGVRVSRNPRPLAGFARFA